MSSQLVRDWAANASEALLLFCERAVPEEHVGLHQVVVGLDLVVQADGAAAPLA